MAEDLILLVLTDAWYGHDLRLRWMLEHTPGEKELIRQETNRVEQARQAIALYRGAQKMAPR